MPSADSSKPSTPAAARPRNSSSTCAPRSHGAASLTIKGNRGEPLHTSASRCRATAATMAMNSASAGRPGPGFSVT